MKVAYIRKSGVDGGSCTIYIKPSDWTWAMPERFSVMRLERL